MRRSSNGQFEEQDPLLRFFSKVTCMPNGCWQWTGSRDKDDYGKFELEGKPILAHRFSYETLVGKIPDELVPDHLCRNHWCVNPIHLEPVTRGENTRRGDVSAMGGPMRSKTYCPRGHPYDEENTYIDPRGKRQCKTCRREVNRRRRLSCRNEN